MTDTLQDIINRNRVWYCLDCGKCSAVCPITRWESRQYTSPRLLVEMAIEGGKDVFFKDPLFWSCLTCKRCSENCPSGVHFSEFLREARSLARLDGCSGECTHGDMIQTLSQMMTNPAVSQNRLDWLTDGLKVSENSDTVYFVGCLPYYDLIFKKLGFEGVEIAQAAVKILNHLGIEPIVMADERCCGHDQFWQGDLETFSHLAKLNLESLKATGAKRIVTTCPECARTLKIDYPKVVDDHNLDILHITELLAQSDLSLALATPEGDLTPTHANETRVTYQDPCRLGRHLGIYDAPRKVMAGLGFELTEMARTRDTSLCCGTSCWTSCGQVSKNIQVERLQEAKATGSELLVTACVKCQIHFKCAQDDLTLGQEIDIGIRDLTTLIAENLS